VLPSRGLNRGGVVPRLAIIAGFLHTDGLPDIAISAWCLDQAGVAAKAGEAQAGVLAQEGMGVVFAHGGRRILIECCVFVRTTGRWRPSVGGFDVG